MRILTLRYVKDRVFIAYLQLIQRICDALEIFAIETLQLACQHVAYHIHILRVSNGSQIKEL